MKRRTLYLTVFAVGAALVGSGVVYTTGFEKVGAPGAARSAQVGIEDLALTLEEHVRYQSIDVGSRPASKQGTANEMLDYLVWRCAEAGFDAAESEYRASESWALEALKVMRSPAVRSAVVKADALRQACKAFVSTRKYEKAKKAGQVRLISLLRTFSFLHK